VCKEWGSSGTTMTQLQKQQLNFTVHLYCCQTELLCPEELLINSIPTNVDG